MIKNQKDLFAGLLFVAFGVGFAAFGTNYSFGRTQSMGPGYFPTVLGVVLAMLGLATCFLSLKPGKGEDSPYAWKALIVTTLATVVFGLTVRGAGLVPAVIVLVVISAWVSIRFSWISAIPLAIGLSAFSWFVFVREIGLPFPPFGSWFGN